MEGEGISDVIVIAAKKRATCMGGVLAEMKVLANAYSFSNMHTTHMLISVASHLPWKSVIQILLRTAASHRTLQGRQAQRKGGYRKHGTSMGHITMPCPKRQATVARCISANERTEESRIFGSHLSDCTNSTDEPKTGGLLPCFWNG